MLRDLDREPGAQEREGGGALQIWPLGSRSDWLQRERRLNDVAAQPEGAWVLGEGGHADVPGEADAVVLAPLQDALVQAAREQHGCVAHSRTRRVGVTPEFDGQPLLDFLARRFPHVPGERWEEARARGELMLDGRPARLERSVRTGALLEHHESDVREPEIATELRVLWADHAMWVVDKPAPLPVHPCGRFGRNTFTALAQRAATALGSEALAALEWRQLGGIPSAAADAIVARPVHRLDADTRGLLVVARSRAAARVLTRQWEQHEVIKLYRARVDGDARGRDGWLQGSIGLAPTGRIREVVGSDDSTRGRAALTYARVIGSEDGHLTTTLLLSPWSGRTNQLRVHLATMGLPIVGDDDHVRASHRAGADEIGGAVESGRTLALEATHLELRHPFDGRRLRFVVS